MVVVMAVGVTELALYSERLSLWEVSAKTSALHAS